MRGCSTTSPRVPPRRPRRRCRTEFCRSLITMSPRDHIASTDEDGSILRGCCSASESASMGAQRRAKPCCRATRCGSRRRVGIELPFRSSFRRVVGGGKEECVGKRQFVNGSQRQKKLAHK